MAAPAPDVFVIVDEIRGFIEPSALYTKDDSGARPTEYAPDTVYVYPDTEEHLGYESGPGVKQDFAIVVDFTVDDGGEQAAGEPSRDVTDALRARAAAMAQRVRDNQHTTLHDELHVNRIEWLALRGLNYRGFRMRLAGYRLVA